MKSQKAFVLAVIVAALVGVTGGVAYTQANTGVLQQGGQRPLVLGEADAQAGQQTNPELEVKPGDNETIKALKTELKTLRQRVEKLERDAQWRIRPAAPR